MSRSNLKFLTPRYFSSSPIEIEDLRHSDQQRNLELEQQFLSSQQRIGHLESQLQQQRAELDAHTVERAHYRDQVRQSDAVRQQIQNELGDAQRKYQTEIDALQSEIEMMRQRGTSELRSAQSQLVDVSAQLEESTLRFRDLSRECETLRDELSRDRNALVQSRQQLSQLDAALKQSQSEIQVLKQQQQRALTDDHVSQLEQSFELAAERDRLQVDVARLTAQLVTSQQHEQVCSFPCSTA